MTAPAGRRGRRLAVAQRFAALAAVVAGLAALCLPGPARADAPPGYDQMTGVGPTASSITVPWTQGLLDPSNTPITAANADRTAANPTSPLSFMYPDFASLAVTVSQTEDIGHQGITVSWTGGEPTAQVGTVQANFLQMMECYGDAASGPTPEQCEYGSKGLLGSGSVSNPAIGERTGNLCPAGATPSVTSPPGDADGSGAPTGCDTQEASDDPSAIAPCPGPECSSTTFTVPFAPVSDPTSLDYAGGTTFFDESNTDEVQEAITNADGTGQRQFETLTGTQAPGLGCGQAEDSGQTRNCWLVIVPRGQYEPNGFKINVNSTSSAIDTSPLSASNWAQRIQIHLGFAPVQAFCPIGTLERQTVGTQMVARAMQSWQLQLNQAANCAKVYGYSAVPESTATSQLTSASTGTTAGLAFTTIPIGSEATREPGGTAPTGLPPVVYAPVAVAAVDFGFNINYGTAGYITTPVKLTPLLLAKALTQSYRQDLPDYFPVAGKNGPAWAQPNPTNITTDPEFAALNPDVPSDPTGPIAPLLTEDHSGPNQQVWQWIQADSAAAGWLGGTPDASDQGMVIDPAYQSLDLGTGTAADSYPRAYSTCLDLGPYPPPPATATKEEKKCSLDLLPYTDNSDSAAAAVLAANNPDETGNWNSAAQGPDNTPGWWDKAGVEALGQTVMWAADDTPDLAAYGLIPAQLCDASGSTCVSPSTASVTAAVSAATADSSGLLQVNPASPGTGAYPLVDVIYAAVATNQDPAALTDYADLISYAAGAGQTPGAAPGDLPPGYLPLPASLQTQAKSVAAQLQTLASGSPKPSTSDSSSTAGQDQGGNTTPAGTDSTPATDVSSPAPGTGTTPAPGTGTTPAPATSSPSADLARITAPISTSSHSATAGAGANSPGGTGGATLPPAASAAGTTPRQVVGAIRWALTSVVIAGGAFAGGGALLRAGLLPPWLRRRKLD